ncbi:putative Zn-binding protein involved in type VI secretion [Acinetobacter sp. BIGb0102]|uniref:PAAR domain-containing protein n=1 Tax=Acinetobacter sp. BIGb0102 TaxID=2485131 RepID=UPI000F50A273|nr:PAAR domain-containing protein [Acinetobacter sp. BIGb0102]RPE30889.1 putative Zn-binding protein involved in type VI secretion [Acinetobacter sp. BIGb0102]
MATPYIVVGCPTTGGGQVISGNSMFLIEGIPVACVGDKATCPKHKTVATIISGDPYMQIFGKAAARVNDSLSCGCKLLPKQSLVVQDNGGGVGSGQSIAPAVAPNQDSFVKENPDKEYEIQFQLKDEQTQKTFSEIPYSIIYKKNGKVETGWTDAEGKTHIINANSPDEVEFQTIDASKPLPPL